ncbi:hypothetical protein DN407_30935 (plasmid) [Bacillus sp. JAS24-2]|uniref:hypothetical protein n=1 Tax=Bacillus sp. JAS24-2 TaxID=2217832 RepID=UPI0011F08406|nr:hypothetical protein [Bacillus sp. JAS24-2]QEL82840.1 hypothetical protein DN407_30935 [Bacillus sp. JAS24-2]
MFGSKENDIKENDIKEYLIQEGYEIKEYLRKNGDWYHFKVHTFWSGTHLVKVKDGVFGFRIEKHK